MTSRLFLVLGIGPLVAAAACAYPDFEYECRFFTNEGCAKDAKCALVDPNTDTLECVPNGAKRAWQRCSSDSDCERGTLCDLRFLACKPICRSATDCQFSVNDGNGTYSVQGECVAALGADGKPLGAAYKHCTAACEPMSASPCDRGSGVKCFLRQNQGFDCALGGLGGLGQDCADELDCGAGLVCVESAETGFCYAWCDNVGNACANGNGNCVGFTPPFFYSKGPDRTVEYGACP